jgi:peptidoglycan hydrolase CwlO-like protein
MEKTITLLVAILTALGVGGWSFLRWILSRKEDKRMSAAKAMAQEMETLMRNYSAMEKKIDKLEQKVDNLYKTVHQLEGEKLQLIKEKNELELKLKEAERHICLRPESECDKRLSTRFYCTKA